MAPGVGGATTGGVGPADILLTPIAATVPNRSQQRRRSEFVPPPPTSLNLTICVITMAPTSGMKLEGDLQANPKYGPALAEVFGGVGESSGKQAGLLMPNPEWRRCSVCNPVAKQKNAPLSPAFAPLLAKGWDWIEKFTSAGQVSFTTPLTNFAPRIGLAYQLTSKLVARGGYGMFYGGFENLGGAPDPGYDYPFTVNLAFSPRRMATFFRCFIPTDNRRRSKTGSLQRVPIQQARTSSPNGLGLIGSPAPLEDGLYARVERIGAVSVVSDARQTITVGYIGNNTHHLLNGEKRNIPNLLLPPGTTKTPYLPLSRLRKRTVTT